MSEPSVALIVAFVGTLAAMPPVLAVLRRVGVVDTPDREVVTSEAYDPRRWVGGGDRCDECPGGVRA
jgi:hypothetical protein